MPRGRPKGSGAAGPQTVKRWYLEMGPSGEFVAKYKLSPASSSESQLRTKSDGESSPATTAMYSKTLDSPMPSTKSTPRTRGGEAEAQSIAGKAMTTWWLKLTMMTALNGTLILALFEPELEALFGSDVDNHPSPVHQVIFALRGLCAASALCVGCGYYCYSITYNMSQSPSLCYQLYLSSGHTGWMSYLGYFAIDNFVHAFMTVFVYLYWREFVTPTAVGLTFLFHRWWSLKNSNFTTPFLKGDKVYGIKSKVATDWMWFVAYVVECSVLLALYWLSSGGKSTIDGFLNFLDK